MVFLGSLKGFYVFVPWHLSQYSAFLVGILVRKLLSVIYKWGLIGGLWNLSHILTVLFKCRWTVIQLPRLILMRHSLQGRTNKAICPQGVRWIDFCPYYIEKIIYWTKDALCLFNDRMYNSQMVRIHM